MSSIYCGIHDASAQIGIATSRRCVWLYHYRHTVHRTHDTNDKQGDIVSRKDIMLNLCTQSNDRPMDSYYEYTWHASIYCGPWSLLMVTVLTNRVESNSIELPPQVNTFHLRFIRFTAYTMATMKTTTTQAKQPTEVSKKWEAAESTAATHGSSKSNRNANKDHQGGSKQSSDGSNSVTRWLAEKDDPWTADKAAQQ